MIICERRIFLRFFFSSSFCLSFCLRKLSYFLNFVHDFMQSFFCSLCGYHWMLCVYISKLYFCYYFYPKKKRIVKCYFGDTESVIQYNWIWALHARHETEPNAMVRFFGIWMKWHFKWCQVCWRPNLWLIFVNEFHNYFGWNSMMWLAKLTYKVFESLVIFLLLWFIALKLYDGLMTMNCWLFTKQMIETLQLWCLYLIVINICWNVCKTLFYLRNSKQQNWK